MLPTAIVVVLVLWHLVGAHIVEAAFAVFVDMGLASDNLSLSHRANACRMCFTIIDQVTDPSFST